MANTSSRVGVRREHTADRASSWASCASCRRGVIGLAEDYSWAVVGDPGREYLWILARTRQLDERSLAAARAVAQDNGFAIERLAPTPQITSNRALEL